MKNLNLKSLLTENQSVAKVEPAHGFLEPTDDLREEDVVEESATVEELNEIAMHWARMSLTETDPIKAKEADHNFLQACKTLKEAKEKANENTELSGVIRSMSKTSQPTENIELSKVIRSMQKAVLKEMIDADKNTKLKSLLTERVLGGVNCSVAYGMMIPQKEDVRNEHVEGVITEYSKQIPVAGGFIENVTEIMEDDLLEIIHDNKATIDEVLASLKHHRNTAGNATKGYLANAYDSFKQFNLTENLKADKRLLEFAGITEEDVDDMNEPLNENKTMKNKITQHKPHGKDLITERAFDQVGGVVCLKPIGGIATSSPTFGNTQPVGTSDNLAKSDLFYKLPLLNQGILMELSDHFTGGAAGKNWGKLVEELSDQYYSNPVAKKAITAEFKRANLV